MNVRRLILIVVAIFFVCNLSLLLVVQKDGELLSLSVGIGMSEILALIVALWYWQSHYQAKKKAH